MMAASGGPVDQNTAAQRGAMEPLAVGGGCAVARGNPETVAAIPVGMQDARRPIGDRTLWYGDNLTVMREIPDASIDLIYLDPPFKSDRNYNVFLHADGEESPVQIRAFNDTWKWDSAADNAYNDLMQTGWPTRWRDCARYWDTARWPPTSS